jgi:hypothetical protein
MFKKFEKLYFLYPYFLFGLIILLFYWPLRRAGFIVDDPQYIWFSTKNSIYKILFDPLTYMYLSFANFTPLLGLTLKIDSYLFKGDPLGYNLHSFLSLFLTSSMLYMFLRCYTSRIIALCGGILFIISPATVAVASWFSARHYMEGMFWALLSLYLIEKTTNEKILLSTFGAITYFIASLYKEIYVVLPAIAFLLARGNIQKRFIRTLPLWLVLLVYVPYRLYMLGGGIGGYRTSVFSFKGLIQNLISLPEITMIMLFDKFWYIFILFILSMIFLLKKKFIKYTNIFIIYLVLLIPIATLSEMTLRYSFHLAVYFIIIAAVGWQQLKKTKLLYSGFMPFVFLATFLLWSYKGIEVRDFYKQYREQTMAEVSELVKNKDKPFIISTAPELCDLNWYFNGIKKMYHLFYGTEIKARVIFPNFFKYNPPALIQEVLDARKEINSPSKGLLIHNVSKRDYRKGPLSVNISFDGYYFRWEFGPVEGPYTVLIRREDEFYFPYRSIPSKGSYLFAPGFADLLYFRVLYKRPDGREIVSPEFKVRFPSKEKYSYKTL